MNKKWLIAIIAAVVVILIAIPVGFILNIHNSEYDLSFDYQKVDDIVSEIARKHTYYDATNKVVEVSLEQDMINSLIKDLMGSMDLGLPDNIELKDVFLSTKDQRIYINAKYGALNTPLSARLNVDIKNDGLTVKADDLKLAKMNAPGFVKNQIPSEVLTYNIKYADLGLPEVFGVKEVRFGSGNLKVYIELYEDKIADLAVSYRGDILKEIDKVKADQTGAVAAFLDKLATSEALSEAKIRELVKNVLNDEELVNSAMYFATAEDMSKYSKFLENSQQKLMAWLEPVTSIKLEGSVEEIVEGLINDEELKEFASWFVSRDKIDEYTETVKDYTTKYVSAMASFNEVATKLGQGDIAGAVSNLTQEDSIKEFLALFLDRNEVEKYASEIDLYYVMYNNAILALNKISEDVNSGNIAGAVETLISDRGIKDFLAMFVAEDVVSGYANEIGDFYNKYTGAMDALNKFSASISSGNIESAISSLTDDEAINEFLTLFVEKDVVAGFVSDIEEYYGKYERAMASLNAITAAINDGDIDAVVTNLIDNDELEEFLGLFLDKDALDRYTAEVENYYNMYQDYLAQISEAIDGFEKSIAAIDIEAIKNNAEAFKTAAAGVKDVKQFLLDQVELIDPDGIQELAALWESDEGTIGATIDYFEPTWEETMKYVSAADETKANLRRAILNMDLSSVDELNALVDDWSNFTIKFVTLLQNKEYQVVADMIVNNEYSDPEMKAFIDKYADGKFELTALSKLTQDVGNWWANTAELINKLANMEYEEAYEIFVENYVAESGPKWAFGN